MMHGPEEESAQVYKGLRGMQVAFNNLLDEMEKGDEYCFFGVNTDEIKEKRVVFFLQNYHKKRFAKGVSVKGIADTSIRKYFQQSNIFRGKYQLRYYKLSMPVGIVIGKKRVLMVLLDEDITVYEILSKRIVKRNQDYFKKIWKLAKN